MKRVWWMRLLAVFPYTAFVFLPDMLIPAEAIPVSSCMMRQIFGGRTVEGMTFFVMTMDRIGFLLLFNILYGNYIAQHFSVGSVYVFSRVVSRKRWWLGQLKELFQISLTYSILYTLLNVGIACRCSLLPLTWADGAVILFLAGFVLSLTFTSTVVINTLATAYGTARAFLTVYAVMMAMVIFAITNQSTLLSLWNPMSCVGFFFETAVGKAAVVVCHIGWFLAGIIGSTRYMIHKDLLMPDHSL